MTHIMDPSSNSEPGFWPRQFSNSPTRSQLIYDAVFGVAFPVLAFWADPIVFNNRFADLGLGNGISHFKPFAYFFSVIAIMGLVLHLTIRDKRPVVSGILAGAFLSGALVCLVVGIWILPLSLLGLYVVVGVFGFLPFFTALVYLRNGVRLLRRVRQDLHPPMVRWTVWLGVLLVAGSATLAQWQISRGVDQLIVDASRGDTPAVEAGVRRLRWVAWASNLDPLFPAYLAETDGNKKALLAHAARELGGDDLELRARMAND